MKKVTSVTFWNDAVGKRLSITYSEIDDTTGKIIRDNYRIDRVLVDKTAVAACDSIADVAQAPIASIEYTKRGMTRGRSTGRTAAIPDSPLWRGRHGRLRILHSNNSQGQSGCGRSGATHEGCHPAGVGYPGGSCYGFPDCGPDR